MSKEYRPRTDLDETLVSKIREIYPDLVIAKLVNDLLFHYILVSMEEQIPDALHPGLLRKTVSELKLTQREEREDADS